MKSNKDDLTRAVERLHGCTAQFSGRKHIIEIFEGQPAWDGEVHVFKLSGHPTATICYAWDSPVEGSDRRKFYAVLHEPPVDSPEKAVRAAIVSDYRDGQD